MISIVIPIYNEGEFLLHAVNTLTEELNGIGEPYELILAENGSMDGTSGLVDEIAQRDHRIVALHVESANYGRAMREGFMIAKGDRIFNFDIDYTSTDLIKRTLEAYQDSDVVILSKRVFGTMDERPLYRKVITRGFNIILRALFGVNVVDTHGIKGFKREVIEKLLPEVVMEYDLFDTELVVRAEKAGFKILELPAQVSEVRVARSSILSRIPRTFLGLIKLRIRMRG